MAAVSYRNNLLFLTLAEFFAIAVGIVLSMAAWNTCRVSRTHFLMDLGCGGFRIALLDPAPTFADKGMGVFPITRGSLSTEMRLTARCVETSLRDMIAAPTRRTASWSTIPST